MILRSRTHQDDARELAGFTLRHKNVVGNHARHGFFNKLLKNHQQKPPPLGAILGRS